MSSFRQGAITAAYRIETGICDRLTRRAVDNGWSPAVIPYPGYASARHTRVLGRVILGPASVDPAASRRISGWRRLLTVESPRVDVVEV